MILVPDQYSYTHRARRNRGVKENTEKKSRNDDNLRGIFCGGDGCIEKHTEKEQAIPRNNPFNTRLPLQDQRNLCQPLHNLSQALPDPHEPQRIRPEYPPQASERRSDSDSESQTHLLHTLTYVPVHKGTLRVHEVEFVVLNVY
jgi:hypothetical protein